MHDDGLEIERLCDDDGAVRLVLMGELDLVTGQELDAQLRRAGTGGATVRVDLRALAFMDSSGLRVLLTHVRESRQTGWELEIGRELSPQVARLIELVGESVLWPSADR
ncbi:MAG: STAS domain-containing protein [Solirubrobacteraceae bacterium]